MDQTRNHRTGPVNPKRCAKQDGDSTQQTTVTPANDPFYEAAVNAAKTRAYRAALTAGLAPAEREDLYQEILCDIYRRKGQFDPRRGAPGTFTGTVSAHCTTDFLNARKADRQRLVFSAPEYVDTLEVVAIDRAIHDFAPTQNAANDENGGSSNSMLPDEITWFWGENMDLLPDAETRHDVMAALAYMSGDQRCLMDLLANHRDLAAAAKASGVPSATFYRRVADLQMHLRMFGIRPAA